VLNTVHQAFARVALVKITHPTEQIQINATAVSGAVAARPRHTTLRNLVERLRLEPRQSKVNLEIVSTLPRLQIFLVFLLPPQASTT
jgi:hypothetical protein